MSGGILDIQQTYMRCAVAQAVVDSLQLGIVEQGLQVCPCKLLCRCCQLLQVHITSQWDTNAQSLQNLCTGLLETVCQQLDLTPRTCCIMTE